MNMTMVRYGLEKFTKLKNNIAKEKKYAKLIKIYCILMKDIKLL